MGADEWENDAADDGSGGKEMDELHFAESVFELVDAEAFDGAEERHETDGPIAGGMADAPSPAALNDADKARRPTTSHDAFY